MTLEPGVHQDPPPVSSPPAPNTSDDVALLHKMGCAQELLRRMSGFSNFAISFSIICILAGGITSLQLGLSAVGGRGVRRHLAGRSRLLFPRGPVHGPNCVGVSDRRWTLSLE